MNRQQTLSVRRIGTFAIAALLPGTAHADDQPALPVSVPVMVLSARPAAPAASVPAGTASQPQVLQPTLPGGKLPQYRLGPQQRAIEPAERRDDPRLRLLLALPRAPVLLEAVITIDGQPFRMARERRVTALLEAATAPEAIDAETDGAAARAAEQPSETGNASKGPGAADENVEAESEPSDAPGESAESPVPLKPPSVPDYSLATSAGETIRRYIAAGAGEVSVEEIRWVMTNWIDGPVVLLLNENFQRFRAGQQPALQILDRDRDGALSAEEIENASDVFLKCDLDRDGVVDVTEVARAAADPRQPAAAAAGPGVLLVELPDEQSAAALYSRLAARYAGASSGAAEGQPAHPLLPRFDPNADGRWDADERQLLDAAPADLQLTIAFDTADPSRSTISVSAISDGRVAAAEPPIPVASTLSLMIDGTPVTFSAVQSDSSDQVSVGCVDDGYPLLPELDPNDDGRFTIRELRQLADRLRSFDRDQDSRLSPQEVHPPVRVCFGLGPVVHRVLAGLRSTRLPQQSPIELGPDWFVQMDRNRDHDLTRNEFPGTDEQFSALDADADHLVSAREALDFDNRSQPANPATPPRPSPAAESTDDAS